MTFIQADSTSPPGTGRRRARTLPPRPMLALLLTGQFMALLDVSIVNVAAPSLRADLHASGAALQMVIAGYTIAYAVLLITGSRLGDLFGYARIFQNGLLGFTLASLGCAFAPSVGVLIGFRFVQGAAAALMVPQVISLIQRSFSGPERVRALGAYTAVLASGVVAGQVVGGILVGLDLAGSGWRPAFAVNVPIGIALLLAVRGRLPEGGGPGRRGLDLPGLSLLGTAVLLLVVPLVLGHEERWPLWGWLMLGTSVLVTAGFLIGQHRRAASGGHPLIDPLLLRTRGLPSAAGAIFLLMVWFGGLFLSLTLHLQGGLRHGPLVSGLILVPMAAGFGLAGLHWRRLPARWHRPLPVVGLVGGAGLQLVLGLLLRDGRDVDVLILLVMALIGIFSGCSYGTLMAAALRNVPPQDAADASGVVVTLIQLGQVIGVATLGSLFLGTGAATVTATGGGQALLRVELVAAGLVLVAGGVAAAGARRG